MGGGHAWPEGSLGVVPAPDAPGGMAGLGPCVRFRSYSVPPRC